MPPVPAKRQRMDRRKTVEKVAKAVMENPRGNVREIAKAAGVDHSTVARVKKSGELPQTATKDDRILEITDTDAQILQLGQKEILRRFSDPMLISVEQSKDISGIIKDSAARHLVFRGTLPKGSGNQDGLTPEAAARLTAALAALGK